MTQKIALIPSRTSKSQQAFFQTVASGLKRHGLEIVDNMNGDENPKTIACWSWRVGRKYRELGHNVLLFERGYLGDRFHWTSIAWNGLNGNGEFCLPDEVDSLRFDQHFKLADWKLDGKNIIIMGQVSGDASLDGKNLTSFYEKLAKDLKEYYGSEHPVYFKPHPLAGGRSNSFKPTCHHMKYWRDDLKAAMDNAYMVCAYNSNSIVDALVAGVPALSFDKGSMAYSITGHAINERLTINRSRWAHRLAHCQWSPEEIENGDYWERMKQGYIDGVIVRRTHPSETVGKGFIQMLGARP